MIKRILLALGGTPFSFVAVRWAVELAHAHAAAVTAVPVIDTESWRSSRAIVTGAEAAELLEQQPWASAAQRVDEVIGRFEETCQAQGIAHRVVRPKGDPLHTLTLESRHHDLVVFGLRGLFDYGIMPDPEQAVARLVREGVWPLLAVSEQYRPIRRVLVAYSGSLDAARAMKSFVQLRPWPDSAVHLACFGTDVGASEALLDRAADYCRGHGLEVSAEAVAGNPQAMLLPYADKMDADLVVLGSGFRSLLASRVMGDTTLHLVRHADRPLFLAH